MHRSRSKRTQIIRTTAVYTVMLTAILAGLTMGVLYTLGYRLDTTDGSIAQGGLLQVGSIPSGARVMLDNRQLSGTTPVRVDAPAGSHTIQIARDGYRSWQKTVTVDPGVVHWANYARLVPTKPAEQVQRRFEALHAVLPAAERDGILMQLTSTDNTFQFAEISGDQPNITELELPRELASTPRPTDSEPTYRMMQWDESDRLVLMEYNYPDYRGWIVLDTRSPADSVNISELLDDPSSVRKIMFDERDGRALYVLINDVIRRLDTSNRTLSAPLARGVTDMWQSHDGIITFATRRDEDGNRMVGYYTRGASQSRTLQRFAAAEGEAAALAVGEYHGRQYAAVQRGLSVQVYRLSLHSSDSSAALDLTPLATVAVPEDLRTLAFSPNDRFVYMQYGATYTVYDIELAKVSITTVQGDEPVDRPLAWLDRYHIWSDRGERLRWYEFDGENAQDITTVAPGFMPKLIKNDRYLYVVQRASEGDGYALVRVQLRI